LKFALKGAAVDPEDTGGFGDVAATIGENAVDVFPFGASEGSGGVGGFGGIERWGVVSCESSEDLVGIGGFGEVVDGSETHGVDSGGDTSVACQDNDFDRGIEGMDLLEQLKPGTFGESEIQDDFFGGVFENHCAGGFEGCGGADFKTTISQGAGEAFSKDIVVVHHQDGRIERCVGGIHQYPFLFSWRRAKQSRFYREKANKEEGAATICHIP